MNTSNENGINCEIYPNENFNNYKFLQIDFPESNKNIDSDREKIIDKKLKITDTNNEFNLNIEKEKKCENDTHSLKINYKKITKFKINYSQYSCDYYIIHL